MVPRAISHAPLQTDRVIGTDPPTYHYQAAKHGERVGSQNFSVVDPVQYSERFQKFVADALV